jgi:galactan endo-beta-1,3-galactanase
MPGEVRLSIAMLTGWKIRLGKAAIMFKKYLLHSDYKGLFSKSDRLGKCIIITLISGFLICGKAVADWETIIDVDSFNSYGKFESTWNYLYPWGSDHNGTARMYGSSSDHNHTYLNNGVLTLKASRISWNEGNSSSDPYLPIHYHSGAVHAKHKVIINDQYPNYEIKARIKAPSSRGTWPAFWLTGADSWPPESDIMEFKGNNVIWQNTYTGRWQNKMTSVSNPGNWHTYRVWISKKNDTDVNIHYYIDGQWKAQHTANFVNKPMWIILNLQMEGSSGNPGPNGGASMLVDWVYVGRSVNAGISSSDYDFCANEREACVFSGTRDVAYGADGQFNHRTATNRINCNNETFGDPIRGTKKACYVSKAPSNSFKSSSYVPAPNNLSCTEGSIDAWGNGFMLNNITVTNNGDAIVSNWSAALEFGRPVTIVNAWGINISGSGNNLTGTNVDYNGYLAPGQSATFGMLGTSDSSVDMPVCRVE